MTSARAGLAAIARTTSASCSMPATEGGDRWRHGEGRAQGQRCIIMINRIIAAPMEPRVALGHVRSGGRQVYTCNAACRTRMRCASELANDIFRSSRQPHARGLARCRRRVRSERVAVSGICADAGRRALTGRPVLWVAERGESFACRISTPATTTPRSTLGLDKDGNFLALKVETTANIGAYISPMGLHCPTNNLGGLVRRLSHAAHPFARHRRVLQYAADRALSRRRPAGSDLRDRAGDRCRRPRLGMDRGRIAAQQPHRARANALQHEIRVHIRFRRVRAQHG